MGLLVVTSGEKELLKRQFFGRSSTITSSTNASPIVLTVPTGHGFKVNDRVQVSDHATNTAANGTQTVSAVTATTITLSGTTGNGVGGATGTVNTYNIENLSLKLRNDAITPATSDVAGTYTESSFTGYSAKTLNANYSTTAAWGTPSGGNPATIAYPQQSWSPTSSQTCNGYFVIGADTGLLHWSENFASAKNLSSGDTLNLTPQIQLT